ncbi:MAG: glycosylhydrolase-like jelly roll fold domain-containing protein, partial [Verrucomicrobiota bacterium]
LEPLVRREAWARDGLAWIRRATPEGRDYFIAHLGAREHRVWIPLGTLARCVRMDPLDGRTGLLPQRPAAGGTEVWLELAPGESVILRALDAEPAGAVPSWPVVADAGPALALNGEWQVEFVAGGPELPSPLRTPALRSWTELGGEATQRFGGTARYRLEFEAPAQPAADWRLDLGDVRESSRVTLNGQPAGTAWSVPYRLQLNGLVRPGRNVLELEVTNLAANRIRDLDRRKVDWKVMREINFVNINYKPFDATGWPLQPSGLLGPVTLTPLRRTAP